METILPSSNFPYVFEFFLISTTTSNISPFKTEINFNTLTNLVSVSNSTNKKVIWSFINKYDKNIQTKIKKSRYQSKIIKVDTKLKKKFIHIFRNEYFLSTSNIVNRNCWNNFDWWKRRFVKFTL